MDRFLVPILAIGLPDDRIEAVRDLAGVPIVAHVVQLTVKVQRMWLIRMQLAGQLRKRGHDRLC